MNNNNLDSNLYYFDGQAADVAVRFFENVLVHVKGEWAGDPFILEDWQRDEIVRPVFGWKRRDGSRRFRTAYIEIPRKNGKSAMAAGMGLFLLFADNEPGAEIYGAAADRDQAAIVHDVAKQMIERRRQLSNLAKIYKRSIVVGDSFYRVISADSYTKHGFNAHGIVFDELHAQSNRDLYDVLVTSTAARRQPLVILLTTAGFDRQSICYEVHSYAEQILNGTVDDPSFFAFIRAADETDDFTDPDVWRKANPNFGVSVKVEYLETEAKKARNIPAYENTFRRLHLNQWTAAESRWLKLEKWDNCDNEIDPNLLTGSKCYGALDLASSSDLAAFCLCFPNEPGEPEHYAFLWKYYVPGDNLSIRKQQHRVSYDSWVKAGFITATPGDVIDYDYIINDVVAMGEKYNIAEIAFDRWGAFQISNALTAAGFVMVGFGQGFASMAPPTSAFLRLIMSNQISHGRNPVSRWMADNVVVSTDAAGNMKPNKQKSREKIDGIVAAIMALDRAMRHETGGSVYDERGVLEI